MNTRKHVLRGVAVGVGVVGLYAALRLRTDPQTTVVLRVTAPIAGAFAYSAPIT